MACLVWVHSTLHNSLILRIDSQNVREEWRGRGRGRGAKRVEKSLLFHSICVPSPFKWKMLWDVKRAQTQIVTLRSMLAIQFNGTLKVWWWWCDVTLLHRSILVSYPNLHIKKHLCWETRMNAQWTTLAQTICLCQYLFRPDTLWNEIADSMCACVCVCVYLEKEIIDLAKPGKPQSTVGWLAPLFLFLSLPHWILAFLYSSEKCLH